MNEMLPAVPQHAPDRSAPAADDARGCLTGVSLADVRPLRLPHTLDAFGYLRPPLHHAALEMSLELAYMTYAPILFVSALTGQRVVKIMETVDFVSNQHAMRVPTGTLNDVISQAILMNQPPSDKGKRLKIYYMTQAAVKPPRFIVFINDAELAHFSYMRYLENTIRSHFNFDGTPIRMEVREKSGK